MTVTNELMKLICEKLGPFLEGEAAERYREQAFIPYSLESLYALTKALGKKIRVKSREHPAFVVGQVFENEEQKEQALDMLDKACQGYPVGPPPHLFSVLRDTLEFFAIPIKSCTRDAILDVRDEVLCLVFIKLGIKPPGLSDFFNKIDLASRRQGLQALRMRMEGSPPINQEPLEDSYSFNVSGSRQVELTENLDVDITITLSDETVAELTQMREEYPEDYREVLNQIRNGDIVEIVRASISRPINGCCRYPFDIEINDTSLCGEIEIDIANSTYDYDSAEVSSSIIIDVI